MIMFELMNPGIRNILIRIIHHACSLKIGTGWVFDLKIDGPPLQTPQPVIKKFVYRTGMDHKLVARNPVAELPPVTVGTHGNPRVVQDAFQQPAVTRQRNPFVTVRKVAVIVIVPNRKTRDNIRRKLFRVLFPLFFV